MYRDKIQTPSRVRFLVQFDIEYWILNSGEGPKGWRNEITSKKSRPRECKCCERQCIFFPRNTAITAQLSACSVFSIILERIKKEELYRRPIAPFMPIPHRRSIPFALHLPGNITWNQAVAAPDRMISCRSCSRPAISLFFSRERTQPASRYNVASSRIGIVPYRAGRSPPVEIRRHYEVCKPRLIHAVFIPANLHWRVRFARVFTSDAKDYTARESVRAWIIFFTPSPPRGQLYEPAMCSKRGRFNWFARTLPPRRRPRYATFPRGFMNAGETRRSLLVREREFTAVIGFVRDIFQAAFK